MVRSWAARLGAHLGLAAVAVGVVAVVLALVVAPEAAIQGQPQRLMYVHVPGAWTAFAAFACVAVCSIAVLVRHGGPYDAVAGAAAELGVAMTAVTLAEGSIWGHSAWGVWWAWDPRLVSTAMLFVCYVAYLALRALPGDQERVRRRAAVAGLVFSVWVPIAHFSVLWWRTLHQPPTVLRPSLSAPPIAPLMLLALMTSVLAFTLGGAWYVRRRVLQAGRAASGGAAAVPLPRGDVASADVSSEEAPA